MKTIEEKAKAYDEVLEKAKAHINSKGIGDTVDLCKHLFSELSESEDERIRKILYNFLDSALGKDLLQRKCGLNPDSVLTWLEKQKEQKPTSFNEPYNSDDYEVVVEGNATSLKRKEQKPNPLCGSTEEYYREAYYADQPQKEQKPAEVEQNPLVRMLKDKKAITEDIRNGIPTKTIEKERNVKFATPVDVNHTEWSEEDEKNLKQAIQQMDFLEEYIDDDGSFITEAAKQSSLDVCRSVRNWLKSLPERFNLSPKQESSEEEMKVLNSIIDDYEKAAKSFCGYDGKIGLLKAIRDGEYDLSKQEWSEEDETKLNDVIRIIETNCGLVESIRNHYVKFLKSLRPS